MKIALFGYGKMGKEIESIAIQRGHEITLKVNSETQLSEISLEQVDVVIEFTKPSLALNHIEFCLNYSKPIVVGTTGWNESLLRVEDMVEKNSGSLLHASNFSVGVNLFFELNKHLAKLMGNHSDYSAAIQEIHHLQKLDAPSGTAITLAEGILENHSNYNDWKLKDQNPPAVHQLEIEAVRTPDVPGTHVVSYISEIDQIEIKHVANNRKGFALGAVLAAEFLLHKKGMYTMKDVLNF